MSKNKDIDNCIDPNCNKLVNKGETWSEAEEVLFAQIWTINFEKLTGDKNTDAKKFRPIYEQIGTVRMTLGI